MSLYQQIILLKHFFKGRYVIENVDGYYEPLILPDHKIDRHLFWSNFDISKVDKLPPRPNKINWSLDNKKVLQEWLGIVVNENLYLGGNGNHLQVYRNCVHPLIGFSIMNDAIKSLS